MFGLCRVGCRECNREVVEVDWCTDRVHMQNHQLVSLSELRFNHMTSKDGLSPGIWFKFLKPRRIDLQQGHRLRPWDTHPCILSGPEVQQALSAPLSARDRLRTSFNRLQLAIMAIARSLLIEASVWPTCNTVAHHEDDQRPRHLYIPATFIRML